VIDESRINEILDTIDSEMKTSIHVFKEKSVIVIKGNSKPIKDQLKEKGYRWNQAKGAWTCIHAIWKLTKEDVKTMCSTSDIPLIIDFDE
jgi:hypothetical protein